ncbi:hypothetical protein ABK040_011353 [Willaertia magna]
MLVNSSNRKLAAWIFGVITLVTTALAIVLIVLASILTVRTNIYSPIQTTLKAEDCKVVKANMNCKFPQKPEVIGGEDNLNQQQPTMCRAMVQYTVADRSYGTIDRVTYFPHSLDGIYGKYKEGDTVPCFYDPIRPQIVNYNYTMDYRELGMHSSILSLGYIQFAVAGITLMISMFALVLSCCCGWLYTRAREQEEYESFKEARRSTLA